MTLQAPLGAGWLRTVGATALAAVLAVAGSGTPSLAQQEVAVWQPGPQAAGDNTYVGFIDQPAGGTTTSGAPFVIAGWMADTTAQGWAGFDQVQVFDGQMGSGGTALAVGSVGLARPDVAATTGNPSLGNSGFTAQLSGSALQPGVHALALYGHTPDKGWWYTTFSLAVMTSATESTVAAAPAVSINRPEPNESISASATSYTISGSTVDPRATGSDSSGIDQVAVYLNGPRDDPRGTFLGNANITGSDWSLTFAPNLYPWGTVSLYVYARSRITGQETHTVRFITIG
jgi:hypothetical protein